MTGWAEAVLTVLAILATAWIVGAVFAASERKRR